MSGGEWMCVAIDGRKGGWPPGNLYNPLKSDISGQASNLRVQDIRGISFRVFPTQQEYRPTSISRTGIRNSINMSG